MEALSTSVSTLRFSGLSSTVREQYQPFRPSTNRIPSHPHPHFSNRTTSSLDPHRPPAITLESSHHLLSQPPSHGPPLKSPSLFHRTSAAASGYAAALLDVARCNDNVAAVVKDVRAISKLLRSRVLRSFMADATVEDGKKGEVLEEVALRAGSTKHVTVLMKMLGEKRKVGLVGEVLEEFERMYDEWCGMMSVLVFSKEKMEREQLKGIAKQAQMVSGLTTHKVRVRNVAGESLPNFVMRLA
ncbi:hypothetical protein ACLOJK_006236 [Asimina triloba]